MDELDIDEALDRVLRGVGTNPRVLRDLAGAQGAVLSDAVTAPVDVPAAAVSAMDGVAVRSEDTVEAPVSLDLVGVVPAGRPGSRAVWSGEAVRVLTGGVLPDGADAVVRVEDTSRRGERVEVLLPARPGDNVRPRGDAVARGEGLLDAGTVMGPAQLALAASAGVAQVEVHRRPRVGVVSTGDELVPPGEPAGPGQVHDANSVLLGAELRRAGAAVELSRCRDDPAVLRRSVLDLASRCDLVLTSGGVSMGGEYDVVLALAASAELEVWRLLVKPGKPMVHGHVEGTPFVGLPGNPVAAAVLFHVLVRPVLRRLGGELPVVAPMADGVAAAQVGVADARRVQFVRVRRDEEGRWEPTEGQGSHHLRGLADADALARVDPGDGPVPAGGHLRLVPLGAWS